MQKHVVKVVLNVRKVAYLDQRILKIEKYNKNKNLPQNMPNIKKHKKKPIEHKR